MYCTAVHCKIILILWYCGCCYWFMEHKLKRKQTSYPSNFHLFSFDFHPSSSCLFQWIVRYSIMSFIGKEWKKQEVGVAIYTCVSHETMYRGRVCRGGIWSDGSVTFLIVFLRQYNGVSLWNVKNVILK